MIVRNGETVTDLESLHEHKMAILGFLNWIIDISVINRSLFCLISQKKRIIELQLIIKIIWITTITLKLLSKSRITKLLPKTTK